MKIRQGLVLLLVAIALAALTGCTQPTDPGAPANQPPASQGGGIPGY